MAIVQLVCGGLLAVGAHAAESAADDLIVRALELRRKGNDQGALPLFQEAFKQSRSARAAGQLGFCHQGLGQWAEAETYLTTALDKTADPWVVKNHAVIADALGTVRAHVARIEVIGNPAGAEVVINGNVVGNLPLPTPVHVSNGEIEVEVRLAGFVSRTKSFHIDAGQYQRVVLRLEREPTAADPLSPATATGSRGISEAASPSTTPAESNPEDRNGPAGDGASSSGGQGARRAVKWVAWGAGAVGAGVGIYGFVKNRNDVASFGMGCGLDAKGLPRSDTAGTTDAQCASWKNAYESATRVAVVGFVGAAALTAVGFIFWLTEPEASSDGGVALTWCAPSFGPRLEPGVGCALRF